MRVGAVEQPHAQLDSSSATQFASRWPSRCPARALPARSCRAGATPRERCASVPRSIVSASRNRGSDPTRLKRQLCVHLSFTGYAGVLYACCGNRDERLSLPPSQVPADEDCCSKERLKNVRIQEIPLLSPSSPAVISARRPHDTITAEVLSIPRLPVVTASTVTRACGRPAPSRRCARASG